MTARQRWQALAGILVLVVVIAGFGLGPFIAAFQSLTPLAALVALVWGLVPVVTHAERWRCVAHAFQSAPPRATAMAAIYQSSFLNMVLPGGVAGDVLRAIDHPVGTKPKGGSGARVVTAERLLGTAVTMMGAIVAIMFTGLNLAWGLLGLTLTAVLLTLVWLLAARHLPALRVLRALAWSLLMWLSLLALTVYGARLALPELGLASATALGAICLAAMAIPVNVGGWGPREGLTALAAVVWGLPAQSGVTLAATFGVLALIGTLPGAVVLVRTVLRPRESLGTTPGSASRLRA